jgi:small subunit ribosomal protein S19
VTGVQTCALPISLEINPKEVLQDYQHYLDDYPEYKILLGENFETFPGSNEGFGLLDIIRMYRYENYDRVIVDTAPTGHTLRLLSFPDFMKSSMMRLIRIRQALGSFIGKLANVFRRKKDDTTLTKDPVELLEKIKLAKEGKYKKQIRTHCRDMTIIPEMFGLKISVHSGKEFVPIDITPEMTGWTLGDFVMTTKFEVKHGGPGIGATRGSKFISVK